MYEDATRRVCLCFSEITRLILAFAFQILEWAFGKRMTPAERLRKNQRMLDKAIRELDQVRVKLEKQEKTLVGQIKQSAQKGQMGAAKIQAKDLVRTRRYVEKFYGMRSQLQKISLRLQVGTMTIQRIRRGQITTNVAPTGRLTGRTSR